MVSSGARELNCRLVEIFVIQNRNCGVTRRTHRWRRYQSNGTFNDAWPVQRPSIYNDLEPMMGGSVLRAGQVIHCGARYSSEWRPFPSWSWSWLLLAGGWGARVTMDPRVGLRSASAARAGRAKSRR